MVTQTGLPSSPRSVGFALRRVLLALALLGACQSESTAVRGLATVSVSPESASIQAGGTQQFSAVARDEAGGELDGVTFTWTTTDSDVATVTPLGMATGVRGGIAQIRASVGGVRGSGQLSVSETPLLFSDGFESGGGSHTENGFKWNGGGGRVSVTTENPRSGKYSLRFLFGPNAPGEQDWSEVRFDMGATRTEIWIEYYLFVPPNYEHRHDGAGHNKFLALWGSKGYSEGGQLFGFVNTWPSSDADWQSEAYVAAYAGEDGARARDEGFNFIGNTHRDSWIRVRYHIKPANSLSARNGVIEMWRDDTKILEYTSLVWYHSAENGFRNGYLMGWSSAGFTQETEIYLDDFKVWVLDPEW